MKIFFVTFFTLVILVGCSAAGDDYIRGQVPSVISHPVLGNLIVSERELLGPDANQNGIRDDIDIVIDKMPTDRRRGISLYVQQVTRDMIIGSRGVSTVLSEKLSTTAVYQTISDAEKIIYIELVTNSVARKAALATWQGI